MNDLFYFLTRGILLLFIHIYTTTTHRMRNWGAGEEGEEGMEPGDRITRQAVGLKLFTEELVNCCSVPSF